MIQIQGLSKTYRDGEQVHEVLRSLDLEVESGHFVALLGRSGSGKSTLLNCVAGLERPDSGRIVLDGHTITGLSEHDLTVFRRDRIGIVFQFFNLLHTMTVLENVALPALLRGDRRRDVLQRAQKLLAELGLGDRVHEMPDHLSGGEQQRVATARALINQPLLLLADEPTGNLDRATGDKTLQLLRDVNEKFGVTILMATHSREAARSAQLVATLTEGRLEMAPAQPEPDGTEEPPDEPAPRATAASLSAAAVSLVKARAGQAEARTAPREPDALDLAIAAVTEEVHEETAEEKAARHAQTDPETPDSPAESSHPGASSSTPQPEGAPRQESAAQEAAPREATAGHASSDATSAEVDAAVGRLEEGPADSGRADTRPAEEGAGEAGPAPSKEPGSEALGTASARTPPPAS